MARLDGGLEGERKTAITRSYWVVARVVLWCQGSVQGLREVLEAGWRNVWWASVCKEVGGLQQKSDELQRLMGV